MRCPCNKKLRCWITLEKAWKRKCPINSWTIGLMEVAILTGRELKSTDIKKFLESVPGTNNISDTIFVRKADIAVCFSDWDSVCELVGSMHQGGINIMTKSLCKSLIRGQSILTSRICGMNKQASEKHAEKVLTEINK